VKIVKKESLECVECDGKWWSVERRRTITEYRTLGRLEGESGENFIYLSNWKKQKDHIVGKKEKHNIKQYLRCDDCDYIFNEDDYTWDKKRTMVVINEKGVNWEIIEWW
jgi:hypothetical protein